MAPKLSTIVSFAVPIRLAALPKAVEGAKKGNFTVKAKILEDTRLEVIEDSQYVHDSYMSSSDAPFHRSEPDSDHSTSSNQDKFGVLDGTSVVATYYSASEGFAIGQLLAVQATGGFKNGKLILKVCLLPCTSLC